MKLEKNMETLRNMFLFRILAGDFSTEYHIKEYMDGFDINSKALNKIQ